MLSCLDAPDALGKRESEWKLIAMPSIYTNNPYSRRYIFPLERSYTSIFNDCACCHRVDRKNSGHQVDLLLKIFWLSLDCFGSLHKQGWNQDASLADAQSECCVKFIFIVLCHFMMSWRTAHSLPCQRYNIVSTFPGAFNFDSSRVIKVQMVKHWVVSAVECNQ